MKSARAGRTDNGARDSHVVAARTRTTNARGAMTRKRILDTAIQLISEQGVVMTSIQSVIEQSGVARGSILHQFPTRHALISCAFGKATRDVEEAMRALRSSSRKPVSKLKKCFDLLWEQSQTPAGAALAHIQDAAHWDRDLAALIEPMAESFAGQISTLVREMALEAKVREPDALAPTVHLITAAIRGLIIASRYPRMRALAPEMLNELRRMWDNKVGSQVGSD